MADYSGHNEAQLRAALTAQVSAMSTQDALFSAGLDALPQKPRGAAEFTGELTRNTSLRTARDAAKAASQEVHAIRAEWWRRHPSRDPLTPLQHSAYVAELETVRVGIRRER